MRCFVTGCAGFIGSNLVDTLLERGYQVTGLDNLSTGQRKFIESAQKHTNFKFVEGDLLNKDQLLPLLENVDIVFHLAANADVRFGLDNPSRDLQQNIVATFNVLEAMRLKGVRKLAFSSTGSVYGEAPVIPTPESSFFPVQTSIYGASKVSAEGLIQAYSEGFGIQSYIFRFVSILGERYSHGHVFDFYNQLRVNPHELKILGNGKQRKSYLYVQDCIEAIFTALNKAPDKVNIFNLGTDEFCEVDDSVRWICESMKISPQKVYSGGNRGWVGDNPFIFLDCAKIRSLGWKPKLTIKEGIVKTLAYLQGNQWLLELRV